MPFDPSPLTLVCRDGVHIAASRYCGGTRAAVLIAPALGVPRRFYEPFAQFLGSRGYDVLSIDYRGIGDSGRDGDVAAIGLADWGRLDLDAALRYLWEHSRSSRRVLVGHSLGAQLVGLTPECEGLSAIVAVGGSCPHPDLYPLVPRVRMLMLWRLLVPWLTRGRPRFPARRIGFSSVDIPSGIVRDWARWGLSDDYLFDPAHGLDTSRYAQLELPLLSYSFADDDYAPQPAVEALLRRYPRTRIERRHIGRPRRGHIGHFGYFGVRMRESLWTHTCDWLDAL